MKIKIQDTKQLGAIARHVRQSQSLDQETAGLLSGNGLTFISQFENGKETAEIARVFSLLAQLGIELEVSLPQDLTAKAIEKIKDLNL